MSSKNTSSGTELTDREREVLVAYLVISLRLPGWPPPTPTLRQIMHMTSITTTSVVLYYLKRLEKHGLLIRDDGKWRINKDAIGILIQGGYMDTSKITATLRGFSEPTEFDRYLKKVVIFATKVATPETFRGFLLGALSVTTNEQIVAHANSILSQDKPYDFFIGQLSQRMNPAEVVDNEQENLNWK